MEQGWTVDVAPDGAGELSLGVAVEGAVVTVNDGEVWLQGDAGGLLVVRALEAWDADGRSLPARFQRTPEGFSVRVDDSDARYPIEIDPLYTTASWTASGQTWDGDFGVSTVTAGDVNGDGFDDVMVGVSGYGGGTGRAYVYLGGASGLSSTAATTLNGESLASGFGYSVSGAGDVNSDGFDDVIAGAYGYSSSTGRAFVYLGSSSGTSTTANRTITGAASTSLGQSVSGAGDVDGDGFDDVIVGAYNYGSGTSRAYVFSGSSTGLGTTATTTLTGEAPSDDFGITVSGAGDVNGDGYSDVIVGAPYHDYSGGKAYVYSGHGPVTDADGDGVDASLDCDDADASVGAATPWYADTDSDGYGSATSLTACDQPAGYVADTTDCDDSDAAVNPSAAEICDAMYTDENCDGLHDDDDPFADEVPESRAASSPYRQRAQRSWTQGSSGKPFAASSRSAWSGARAVREPLPGGSVSLLYMRESARSRWPAPAGPPAVSAALYRSKARSAWAPASRAWPSSVSRSASW